MVRILSLLFIFVSVTMGQFNETQLKAAIFLKILQTVDWPANEDNTLTVAILGDPEFADEMQNLVSVSPEFASIKVIPIHSIPGEMQFNVLYIASINNGRILKFCDSVKRKPVLIVSDQRGIDMKYLSILLERQGDHITFDINLTNIEEKNLRINARVLKLARKVYY